MSSRAGAPYWRRSSSTTPKHGIWHLIDGYKVRSLHPQSHFVAVIAEAEGVQLTFHCAQETTEQYPHGLPYYKLVAAGGNGR